MKLEPGQRLAAEFGLDVDGGMSRGSSKNRHWPNGVVPYTIDSSLRKYKINCSANRMVHAFSSRMKSIREYKVVRNVCE